ncbi:3-phosphoshikimate 1-carboxyvinyltransferase [Roseomonas frigidaquae]|uniref:3-phosphoshikimate 1-carboxyvinyltransferase n=1 Tax=Falsiroseomonas frigidaquae TaxID=487318 RepID=A0ABX1EXM3_9PROT|nr:3-phosphoshikimate 1-carboxyvinyltransferase [Falsiroseomonas frigidaquae]NKE44852.1 3-phosphoshikimate 1-carboxyvinyltransferase [Falsiroseomonas frigidaquae]
MQAPSETAPKPPRAAAPLSGAVAVPGDRAISHLALILGALAAGTTTITGLLEAPDVLRSAAALRALGARVEKAGDGSWRVAGRGIGGLVEPADVLDLGHADGAAPLFCGLLAGHPMLAVVTGDAALRQQPMRWLTDPLAGTGARFASRAGGRPPLVVEGMAEPLPLDCRLTLPSAELKAADLKAACLLAGLCARGTTRVWEAVATPGHAEHLLRHFGATVRVSPEGEGQLVELDGQPELVAGSVAVPGDPAAAAFLAVAALLVPGSVLTLRQVGLDPLRSAIFAALRAMGAQILEQGPSKAVGQVVADLLVRASTLSAIDLPTGTCREADIPLLAVAAACARGTTRLRGVEHPAPIAALLAANGIGHEMEGNDLLVHGTGAPPEGGGLVETQMNACIALSALVLGLATRRPVRIDDGGCMEAAFPGLRALIGAPAGVA